MPDAIQLALCHFILSLDIVARGFVMGLKEESLTFYPNIYLSKYLLLL